MEIETLGPQALLVYTPLPELRERGVDPRRPGVEALLLLAREALRRRGIPARRLEQLSALGERRSLLLLLRLSEPEEEWFPFPDLALVLEAAAALDMPPEGSLIWRQPDYLLGTRCPRQSTLLSEFASPLPLEQAGELEEEAVLVLDEAALGQLWGVLRRRNGS